MVILNIAFTVLFLFNQDKTEVNASYVPEKKILNIYIKPDASNTPDSMAVYNYDGKFVTGNTIIWHNQYNDFELTLLNIGVDENHSMKTFKNKKPLSHYVVDSVDKGFKNYFLIKYRVSSQL